VLVDSSLAFVLKVSYILIVVYFCVLTGCNTRGGLRYRVDGILAAQEFAIHGNTDNTFEDVNGSILCYRSIVFQEFSKTSPVVP
jgi:hypothetical protein